MKMEVELVQVRQTLDLRTLKESSTLDMIIFGELVSAVVSEDTMATIAATVIKKGPAVQHTNVSKAVEPVHVFDDSVDVVVDNTAQYRETMDFSMSEEDEEPAQMDGNAFSGLFAADPRQPTRAVLPDVPGNDPRNPEVLKALKERAKLMGRPGMLPKDELGNPIVAAQAPRNPNPVIRDDDFPQG